MACGYRCSKYKLVWNICSKLCPDWNVNTSHWWQLLVTTPPPPGRWILQTAWTECLLSRRVLKNEVSRTSSSTIYWGGFNHPTSLLRNSHPSWMPFFWSISGCGILPSITLHLSKFAFLKSSLYYRPPLVFFSSLRMHGSVILMHCKKIYSRFVTELHFNKNLV